MRTDTVPREIQTATSASGVTDAAPVLTAVGIEKSYRRGTWPFRRQRQVLRGGPDAVSG
jgi:hypothetical protein